MHARADLFFVRRARSADELIGAMHNLQRFAIDATLGVDPVEVAAWAGRVHHRWQASGQGAMQVLADRPQA